MNTSWEDAETFLAVAEHDSFSAAAAMLGVGQPTISRRIANLENRLGCQLFTRNKLGAQLTEAGAKLLPAAEQMARWAGEFGRLAQGTEIEPTGTVRVAAPPGLAFEVLAPLAATLREEHPEIRLEVLASVDYIDLARGGADLAVRTRENQEPELTTIYSAEFSTAIYATNAYKKQLMKKLADTGRPPKPYRIEDLDWITWATPYEQVAPRPMLERRIPDFRPAFASDNYLVLKRALLAGLGVMVLEKQGAEDTATENESLTEIDLGFSLPAISYYLICAKSMRNVPRVRAVANVLIDRLHAADERGWKPSS
jgi:DNA-binding transcriptional LysR family regulator